MEAVQTRGRRPRRLLLATDRSAASRAAGVVVAGLAMGGHTEVVVLHVDDRGHPEDAQRLADEVACGLLAIAVNARAEMREAPRGHVADAIVAAAAEHGSDLVVLGSRGRSDLGGLLLGSVAHRVLERAGRGVLLVRAGRRTSARPGRVLIALAGDEDLDDLVRTAAAVAERDAAVLVLHLLAPGDGDRELAMSRLLVQRTVEALHRCGVRARGQVRADTGTTAEEIARTASGYGADVIVMGSRRLPALTSLLHRSVSHLVAQRSDQSVLICGPRPARQPT